MIVRVRPIYDPSVRMLCVKPYPLHPRGCPNFGKRASCPPRALCLPDVYDLAGECFCIVNEFALGEHVAAMRVKHPEWSARQLACCLYWQPRARTALEHEIARFAVCHDGFRVERCPEAMGLNVTATLYQAGIDMEWPPVNRTLQVAFAAHPRSEPSALVVGQSLDAG